MNPLKSKFYIIKLGFTGVYNIFFIIFAHSINCGYSLEPRRQGCSNEYSIDCGYSLEPPRRGGFKEYPNLCFGQNEK